MDNNKQPPSLLSTETLYSLWDSFRKTITHAALEPDPNDSNYFKPYADKANINEHIKQDIAVFKQRSKQFSDMERVIGGIEAVNVLIWLAGYSHWLVLTAGSGLMYFLARPALLKETGPQYYQQFEKLCTIYDAMIATAKNDGEMTFNDTFCDVLEAIFPYVQKENLQLNRIMPKNIDHVSARFLDIIAMPPHNIDLRLQGKGVAKTSAAGIFSQSVAEAKLKMYGKTDDNDSNYILQAINGVRKLVTG